MELKIAADSVKTVNGMLSKNSTGQEVDSININDVMII